MKRGKITSDGVLTVTPMEARLAADIERVRTIQATHILIDRAVTREREACARLVEDEFGFTMVAARIRRRLEGGEKRLHKPCCDEAHEHKAPKCCASDCWCGGAK